ncbi:MAG: GNAT family N-acetyltransferase [Chlorobi bacterium]|nr:GNAT family N-acetyltransferase [Chlorobiota bacterium]
MWKRSAVSPKHRSQIGMSVRKEYWGLGIGELMLDALVNWARNAQLIGQPNVRDNQGTWIGNAFPYTMG